MPWPPYQLPYDEIILTGRSFRPISCFASSRLLVCQWFVCWFCGYVSVLRLFFFVLRFDAFFFDVYSDEGIEAHVDIGDPHQRKARYDVSTPVVNQQGEAGEDQHQDGDVVAEAIFAREEVKELPDQDVPALLAHPYKIGPRLAKYFLMGDGPGY